MSVAIIADITLKSVIMTIIPPLYYWYHIYDYNNTKCTHQFHRVHGFDTFFFGQNSAKPCGSSTSGSDIAGKLAPQYSFYCLIQTDIPLNSVANSENVLAKLLGDEVDSHVSRERERKITICVFCSWMINFVA